MIAIMQHSEIGMKVVRKESGIIREGVDFVHDENV